jgi:hypothetical protein
MIEGVYALQEWSIDGELFAPPQVDGRFVLADGAAITILHNRIAVDNRHSATLFGRYRLTAQSFAYGYEDAVAITYIGGVISTSSALPWSGLREFSVERKQASVRVYSGQQEFVFSQDGFTYAENGDVLRRWRRVIDRPQAT